MADEVDTVTNTAFLRLAGMVRCLLVVARMAIRRSQRIGMAAGAGAAWRVAERVSQGGHDIPEATIRRRFDAGIRNLREIYAPLVDSWGLYDNAGDAPVPLDWGENP